MVARAGTELKALSEAVFPEGYDPAAAAATKPRAPAKRKVRRHPRDAWEQALRRAAHTIGTMMDVQVAGDGTEEPAGPARGRKAAKAGGDDGDAAPMTRDQALRMLQDGTVRGPWPVADGGGAWGRELNALAFEMRRSHRLGA